MADGGGAAEEEFADWSRNERVTLELGVAEKARTGVARISV